MAKELYLPKSAYAKDASRLAMLRSPLGKSPQQQPEENVKTENATPVKG